MSAESTAAIALHPEILRRDGRPQFAVLPYEEYVALRARLEDLEDVLEIRRACQEEVAEPHTPLDEVLHEFDVRREAP
ncbi:MAG: type II toxin-antitoxin system Phd/YefM family antitoxin [Thermoanaerobaculia bacterium]|nr:type II toxin-antitoxin system Phd/YefM family antitoxin [Thermoanaerobaculia bacterium]